MPTLIEQYQQGRRREVWREMIALGAQVRDPHYLPDAQAVAAETMRRAAPNVEQIAARLEKLGYRFHNQSTQLHDTLARMNQMTEFSRQLQAMMPPGGPGLPQLDMAGLQAKLAERAGTSPNSGVEWHRPDATMSARLDEFEASIGGPLPLSLRAWCEQVGFVSLAGDHPVLAPSGEPAQMWIGGSCAALGTDPSMMAIQQAAARSGIQVVTELQEEADDDAWPDPLVVTPYFEEWEECDGLTELALAPDDFHKANISGGDPYGMEVPNAAADGVFLDWHNAYFVDYLRTAFQWGGFPGWERSARRPQSELNYLAEGLLEI